MADQVAIDHSWIATTLWFQSMCFKMDLGEYFGSFLPHVLDQPQREISVTNFEHSYGHATIPHLHLKVPCSRRK
jgi:hypothetical protein